MSERDATPALGSRGGPASWRPGDPDAAVALSRPGFADARWSYLYHPADTAYASAEPTPGQVAEANRRMRAAPAGEPHGPFIKAPVWTWEVPLYFWVGGVASGTAFVAAACDLAGDHESAVLARRLALGAVTLAPPLLIADLGRPERFLNMLRIFKPRSPMNTGAWCLMAFSATAAGAVGADLLGRPGVARGLGAATSLIGGYLGSYPGVLLACTAVPVWARSRHVLGPIFICTAVASGAGTTRLALRVRGLAPDHPTHRALSSVETASILTELALSQIHRRSLGEFGAVMSRGRAGLLYRIAESAVGAGVASRLLGRRAGPRVHDVASGLFAGGALAFRYAWVQAGQASARDDGAVAAGARAPAAPSALSLWRRRAPAGPGHVWSEAVRQISLAVERVLPGRG
jgi:formate-dependent nitrite reductase membrane component NrfD